MVLDTAQSAALVTPAGTEADRRGAHRSVPGQFRPALRPRDQPVVDAADPAPSARQTDAGHRIGVGGNGALSAERLRHRHRQGDDPQCARDQRRGEHRARQLAHAAAGHTARDPPGRVGADHSAETTGMAARAPRPERGGGDHAVVTGRCGRSVLSGSCLAASQPSGAPSHVGAGELHRWTRQPCGRATQTRAALSQDRRRCDPAARLPAHALG